MIAVVVADAPDTDLAPFLPLLALAKLRVAADGGARYLKRLGVQPDLVVGDMDSLAPELLAALEAAGVPVERHPAEKEETDLELALLRAVEQGATSISVLAALGGRPDQHHANLLLLAHPRLRGRDVRLIDGPWEVRLAHGLTELSGQAGDLISLLPLGDVYGVTTEGLYYPLRDEPLLLGPARGVSNVMLGERSSVSVREGALLPFHRRGDDLSSR